MGGSRWIIVTAGGTQEPIDEVRFIGNRSTGATGRALAAEGCRRGWHVVLVHAADAQRPDPRGGLELVPFVTGSDLMAALEELSRRSPGPRAIVHAAAVSDYAPAAASGKIPSGLTELVVRLRPTPKIVRRLKALFPDAALIQFKLEVGATRDELWRAALESAAANGADLVVANDLREVGGGRHHAYLLRPDGGFQEVGDDAELAVALIDWIEGEP
ncbi:MAG: phosphopantothenoylcysteine decarboxylase [Planctomycetota bacterium]